MTLYIDTSALVPIYAPEPSSRDIIDFLAVDGDTLAVSTWSIVEAASALAQKVRVRALSIASAESALRDLRSETSGYLYALTAEDYEVALSQLLLTGPALRAADSLHLAICRRLEARLLTRDREMAEAAAHFGIAVAAFA